MTALNFPSSPTLNQVYTTVGRSWIWNGVSWNPTGSVIDWARIVSAPTTLAGYGIADAQAALVSGTNIKTVNGQSVLGSGNIQIDGGITSFNTRTGAVTLGSGDVTGALGFTPYNATNPTGFITSSALTPYLTSATAASTYQPIGSYLTGITSGQVTTALGFTPYNATNPSGYITSSALSSYLLLTGGTMTGNLTVNTGIDSRVLLQSSGVTQGQFQTTGSVVRLASNNTLPLYLSQNGVDLLDVTTAAIVGNRQFRVPNSASYLYAFVGEQTAGAGKYNLYMSGTAQNWFAGNVGIGSGKSVPTTALDVDGTVTATSFVGSGASLTGVGYKNVPPAGTKTSSYTLTTADIGEYVQVGSGGSITIPDAVFAEGDAVSLFNNTAGTVTITCSITTAYIGGTDADKATMTLAARGVATILFISSTVCVVNGNVA